MGPVEHAFNLAAALASIVGLLCSVVGTLLSVASLAITVKVWFDVGAIAMRFKRRARLPKLVRDLAKWRQTIADKLTGEPHELRLAFADVRGLLSSIASVAGKERGAVDALSKTIDRLMHDDASGAAADKAFREAHIRLADLQAKLQQLSEDDKWEAQ